MNNPDQASRSAALRELVDRADRARARAIANCENLQRALTRTEAFVPSLDYRIQTGSDGAGRLGAALTRIAELEDTVEGLMKRLESQGPIEQAKGIIMSQTHCDSEQAFEILRRASQRSNTKLRSLAVDLVARTSKTEAPR